MIYYDLLLDVAVSDALVAASVLRALRRAARTAGHAELVSKAARAEIETYGVHDASGLLIKLATR